MNLSGNQGPARILPQSIVSQSINFNYPVRKSIQYPINNANPQPIKINKAQPVIKTTKSNPPNVQKRLEKNTPYNNHIENNINQRLMNKNEEVEKKRSINRETKTFKDRIEIMKVSTIYERNKPSYNNINRLSQNNSSINELNLLNYYSDNSELEFVALSPGRISQAV